MSQPVTLNDILQIFERQKEETDRRAAETDRRAAEADRRMAEWERKFAAERAEAQAEADRRAAEADRRMEEWECKFAAERAEAQAEADRRAAEAQAEADRRAVEADRRAAEADRRHQELEKLVAAANVAVNNLTSRWGRFVEELVRPAIIRIFKEKGIHLKHTFLRAEDHARTMEIDILGVNSTDVVLVECKSRLSQDDVDEFLEKLPHFKTAFPEFSAYTIYGAVAGIEIDQGVDRRAYKKGLFVIKPSGDSVTIVNDDKFRPLTW